MKVSRERLPVGRESWEEVQDGSCLHETPRGWHLHSPTTLGKNRLLQAGSWFGSFLLPKEATDPSFKTTSLGMGWALFGTHGGSNLQGLVSSSPQSWAGSLRPRQLQGKVKNRLTVPVAPQALVPVWEKG